MSADSFGRASPEARYRTIFALAPEPMGVSTVDGGVLLEINAAYTRLTGFSPEEAIGKTSVELQLWPDPAQRAAIIAGVRATGRVERAEVSLRCKDGRVLDCALSVHRLDDECQVFVIHDLATEVRLRESEARFRQLVGSIGDVFWLYDVRRDRMELVSQAWETMTGHPITRAMGDGTARYAVVAETDRPRVIDAFTAHAAQRPLRQEFHVITAAGIERPVEERSFPVLDGDGRTVRVAGLITDLSERRRFEEALQRSKRLEALGQLSNGIAHEFNNLIGSILFAVDELAALCQGDADRAELCAMIATSGGRARDLTRQILAFSRQGTATRVSLDVNRLVWDTIAVLRRTVDRRLMILGDLRASPATVLGDPSQLQQALLELGVRARDAMPDGGDLTFETDRVDLDELAASTLPFQLAVGPYVIIKVSDTGAPLAPDARDRIFEPFGGGAGAGLGLAAVYGTAVAHGGAVAVYSAPDAGTQCHLYLPLSPGSVAAAPADAPVQGGSGLVLVVDDEPLLRDALARVLTGLGYTVVSARDGDEAVARFRARPEQFVAVLCDINLPHRAGPDVVRELRDVDPDVPVVMASGFARHQAVARLGDLSVDGFLAKPVRRAELAAVLTAVARAAGRRGA